MLRGGLIAPAGTAAVNMLSVILKWTRREQGKPKNSVDSAEEGVELHSWNLRGSHLIFASRTAEPKIVEKTFARSR